MTSTTTAPRPGSDALRESGIPALRVDGVSLRYGQRLALDAVSFDVEQGSILCLLGASGSGKSSALRLIAGLEYPISGSISIGGAVVAGGRLHVPPERRRVGMVFQDFALFPHLTVEANVAFGMRTTARARIGQEVTHLLDAVGLAGRAGSYPHMLSGGERQRVALVRALAPGPAILLMDEPFSSLDARLRDHVRAQTVDLLRRTATTTVLVTHDPAEAMRVADRVGVLEDGRLTQWGTPTDLYERPCSPTMAAFFGQVNTFPATIDRDTLRSPLGAVPVPSATVSGQALVCVRPHHLELHPAGDRGTRVRVTGLTRVGETTEVRLALGDIRLVASLRGRVPLTAGDETHVSADPAHVLIFPSSGTAVPDDLGKESPHA